MKWIDVKDERPSFNQDVLVIGGRFTRCMVGKLVKIDSIGNCFHIYCQSLHGEGARIEQGYDITHWAERPTKD